MDKIITVNAINQDIKIIIQKDLLVIDTYFCEKTNSQAEFLVSSVEKILNKNNLQYSDIDILSIVNGPGSFISIKATIAFAKAFKAITNKEIIENDLFDIISYNEDFDYVVLNGGFGFFYVKDKNGNYMQQKKEEFINNLLENNVIITNNKDIENCLLDKCIVKYREENIDNIIKLNQNKTKNKKFSKIPVALYIGQPQINLKKS